MDYQNELKEARTFADIFEIVKGIVRESLGAEQAGLLVGVTDLGVHAQGFIGAFYSLDANMIIIKHRKIHSKLNIH